MPGSIESLRPHLLDFDFRRLFVEGLGWDHYPAEPVSVLVNDCEYTLEPVAEKAGFAVYVCGPAQDGSIPPYPVRRKVENRISKLAYEHLIVFIDADRTTQNVAVGKAGKWPTTCLPRTAITRRTVRRADTTTATGRCFLIRRRGRGYRHLGRNDACPQSV